MRAPSWDARSARSELLAHLDYYVQSFMLHTCQRNEDVHWLLSTADRDPLWLMIEWVSSEQDAADHG